MPGSPGGSLCSCWGRSLKLWRRWGCGHHDELQETGRCQKWLVAQGSELFGHIMDGYSTDVVHAECGSIGQDSPKSIESWYPYMWPLGQADCIHVHNAVIGLHVVHVHVHAVSWLCVYANTVPVNCNSLSYMQWIFCVCVCVLCVHSVVCVCVVCMHVCMCACLCVNGSVMCLDICTSLRHLLFPKVQHGRCEVLCWWLWSSDLVSESPGVWPGPVQRGWYREWDVPEVPVELLLLVFLYRGMWVWPLHLCVRSEYASQCLNLYSIY